MKRSDSARSRAWAPGRRKVAVPREAGEAGEQRRLSDRRQRVLWSVVYGSFNARRRRPPRRMNDARYHSLDWHSAHLLAVSIGILILCVGDAVLTLSLMSYGAVEINPVMALLVYGSPAIFAALKMALTGSSVIMLVFLARYRFMRVVKVELILYGVLAGYVFLIAHEFGMLRNIPELRFF